MHSTNVQCNTAEESPQAITWTYSSHECHENFEQISVHAIFLTLTFSLCSKKYPYDPSRRDFFKDPFPTPLEILIIISFKHIFNALFLWNPLKSQAGKLYFSVLFGEYGYLLKTAQYLSDTQEKELNLWFFILFSSQFDS